jgi:hypothetical protein
MPADVRFGRRRFPRTDSKTDPKTDKGADP